LRIGSVAVAAIILRDEDIVAHLRARDAVAWIGEAVDAHHRGELLAPPRAHVELGSGLLVLTAGRLVGSWFGYGTYDTLGGPTETQLVVVQEERSGAVRALALGSELGRRRVGAIGAVAADALAARDAHVVAVVGTGAQAYAQIWALAAVRDVREVRVVGRDPDRCALFVERVRRLVPGAVRPASDARSACEGAQIVLLATSSRTPVLRAQWLEPDAYVATLGPKQQGRAEFGLDLAEAASLLVTDSLDQIMAYEPPHVLAGTPYEERLVSLGAVRTGELGVVRREGVAAFLSVGLAGTEVFLLDRLAAQLARTS